MDNQQIEITGLQYLLIQACQLLEAHGKPPSRMSKDQKQKWIQQYDNFMVGCRKMIDKEIESVLNKGDDNG
jgi:hypothetical protein